jgi:3D (Asp-Asp-Asp) domain-containing protein
MALGTIIVIQGKKYTCEDRKAKRFDGEFDIYMATRSEALEFGRKELVYTVDNSGLDR